MEVNGYDISKNYSNEEVQDLIEKSPYYKATSNDIDWLSKVEMQGAIQKWVDHSISVTINIPNEATEELVNQLYIKAWEVGCKGVTVYRDGSRSGVLVSADDKKESNPKLKTDTLDHSRILSMINVTPKVPLFITYFTLYPDFEGNIKSFSDVYGYDRVIFSILKNYLGH